MTEKNTIELVNKKNNLGSFFPKWGNIISLVLLGVSVIAGSATGFYSYYLSKQASQIASDQSSVSNRIASMKEVEDGVLGMKQKTKAILALMNQRLEFSGKLKFFNLLSEKVVLDKVAIKDDGKFELTGRAPDVLGFSRFLTDLQEKDSAEFDRAVLLSSSRLAFGEYTFVIQLIKDDKSKK